MPGIHIERFFTGLETNRNPLVTPVLITGMHVIPRQDVLFDGSNMEISPKHTLIRRPGFPAYSTATFGTETALGFFSARLNGTLYRFLNTNANVYTFDPTTLASIYTKGTSAQTWAQQVGNLLYFSDGNANKKYDGTTVTNNGIASPTVAPTVTNLNFYDSGGHTQTLHGWSPGFSYVNGTGSPTNYYLLAPTGELFWAGVPASTTRRSASTTPSWASVFNQLLAGLSDGAMNWIDCGPAQQWLPNTGTPYYWTSDYLINGRLQALYNYSGTSTGQVGTGFTWITVTAGGYFQQFTSGTGLTKQMQVTQCGFSIPGGATITGVQVEGYRVNNFNTGGGNCIIQDSSIKIMKAGTATGSNKARSDQWPTGAGAISIYGGPNDLWGTTLTPTDVNNIGFGAEIVANVVSSNGGFQGVFIVTAVRVFYRVSTTSLDGVFVSTIILDSNGNYQRVKVLGVTGLAEPTWATTVGNTTTDNTMTWECLGTASQLGPLFSWTYAYGFHTLSSHISTMSAQIQLQAPLVGTSVPITGKGTDDTQCDTIDLYRTLDGGSLLYFDQNTARVSSATPWTITDSTADADLNNELIGPVAHANDPPPAGMTLLAWHMGRVWGVVNDSKGGKLYFSAGPDCINGDGNQSWPPANVFPFDASITGLAANSSGLLVFTPNDLSTILGGPQTLTFWVQPLLQNFGIETQNCMAQDGDDLVVYTSQRQCVVLSQGGKNEIGINIADLLQKNFDPTTTYVTVHREGQDQGIFLSNGIMPQTINSAPITGLQWKWQANPITAGQALTGAKWNWNIGVLTASGTGPPTNVLLNGSFQLNNITIPDWTIDSGTPNVIGIGGLQEFPDDPNNNTVGVSSSATAATIHQTITTTNGHVYTFFFYLVGSANPGDGTVLSAFWNGTLLQTFTDYNNGGPGNWTKFTYSVTGTGSDTVKFVLTDPTTFQEILVDEVWLIF